MLGSILRPGAMHAPGHATCQQQVKALGLGPTGAGLPQRSMNRRVAATVRATAVGESSVAQPAETNPNANAAAATSSGTMQQRSSSQASTSSPAAAQAAQDDVPSVSQLHMPLLPEKNFGNLRGGQYPFLYDPGYGLPVVREVVSYGSVLAAMREGRVTDILWFPGELESTPDGRCLVVYDDGRVAQSSLLPWDLRLKQAMTQWGVKAVVLPPEPKDVPVIAQAAVSARPAPLAAFLAPPYLDNVELPHDIEASGAHQGSRGAVGIQGQFEDQSIEALDEPAGVPGPAGAPRRGPALGPSAMEALMAYAPAEDRAEALDSEIERLEGLLDELRPIPQDRWNVYLEHLRIKARGAGGSSVAALPQGQAASGKGLFGWMDNIKVDMDTQAIILKYAPILGPVVGSSFIIGLYLLARLFKGDLTDRLKMMDQDKEKAKRQALKEARIAFLEEEVPAMVAKGASIEQVQAKVVELNKKLGPKLELSDTEVTSTYDACRNLLTEGIDLSAASASAGTRMVAAMEAQEKADAAAGASEGGGGGAKGDMDAFMEMGKLNTARIKKAVDPKIMDVKRRVRAARRKLKRESKVSISDEVVFFDDVAGNTQAKVELMEVVDFFRSPEKFKASGAKAPKGVLLVGPPGNGKTLMARAVAGEAGVAFISSSAAEFIELYMGLGAARVRDLFNTARSLSPCIIFIDELDAVGRQRQGAGKSNDERDNTVNQLLTEMDGFEAESQGIVVLAATNRKDVLDAALTRPGRFDRSIEVRRPDFAGRLEAVKVHLRDKPIGPDIDYKELAAATGGMSGAQIAGVANLACFLASREGRSDVEQADLLKAVEQSKYGRATDIHRFVGPTRKRRFAVMEAGISLAATLLPAMEPVDFVTIVPSLRSPLGRTVLKPNIGRYSTGVWTKRYLTEQLQVALAGRAAEEVVLGRDELSSLNQQRLMFARQIAIKMANSGMSDHPDYANIRGLGSNTYDPSSEPGRFQMTTVTLDYNQTRSEGVDMDMEVEQRLNTSYGKVKGLLERNRKALDALVELLLSKERVSGDEVRELVEGLAHKDDLAARAAEAEVALL